MTRSYLFEDRTRSSRRKDTTTSLTTLRSLRRDELRSKRHTKIAHIPEISNFAQISKNLFSSDLESVYDSCVKLRKCLSKEDDPPIESVLSSGVVSRVIELVSSSCSLYENALQQITVTSDSIHATNDANSNSKEKNIDPDPQNVYRYRQVTDQILQTRIESAWILTNLASGTTEQTMSLIDYGTVKVLCACLNETSFELVDQCVWALGNISGDVEQLRDIIIEQDCAARIVSIIQMSVETKFTIRPLFITYPRSMIHGDPSNIEPQNSDEIVLSTFNDIFEDVLVKLAVPRTDCLQLVRNCIWLISNLCRGSNPVPELGHLITCYNTIKNFVFFDDHDILSDSLWCISYICDASQELCTAVLNSKIMPRIIFIFKKIIEKIDQVSSSHTHINHPKGVRFVLQNEYTDLPKDSNCLNYINPLLRLFGNIITGDDSQTIQLFKICALLNFDLIESLKKIYHRHYPYGQQGRIQKEICWIISNLSGTDLNITVSKANTLNLSPLNASSDIYMYPKDVLDPSNNITYISSNQIFDPDIFLQISIIDHFEFHRIYKILSVALENGSGLVKQEAIWALFNLSSHKKAFSRLTESSFFENLGFYIEDNLNKHEILNLICIFAERLLKIDKEEAEANGHEGKLPKQLIHNRFVDSLHSLQDTKELQEIATKIINDYFPNYKEYDEINSYDDYDDPCYGNGSSDY